MNKKIKTLISLCVLTLSFNAFAEPKLGETAPDFELKDSKGKTHKLSQYRGKFVVLEWLNHDCPFVVKHYTTDEKYKDLNMQSTQKMAKDQGTIWLSINSTAESNKDYKTPEQTNELIEKTKTQAHAVLLDPKGTVGRKYDAKTTPHMFVINPEGKIIYMGAIDDNSSSRLTALNGARNYVREALQKAKANETLAITQTKPYGCSVKYAKK
jgi:peroxiredoxin